jgi:hypothetical protein
MAGVLANAPNLAGTLQRLTSPACTRAANEDDTLRWTDPNYVLVVAWGGPRFGPATVGSSFSLSRMASACASGASRVSATRRPPSRKRQRKIDIADSLAYTATARASYAPRLRSFG